jgi:hypothetical protein
MSQAPRRHHDTAPEVLHAFMPGRLLGGPTAAAVAGAARPRCPPTRLGRRGGYR